MLKLVIVQFKLLLNVSNDLFKATNIYGTVRKVGGNLAYKELKRQVKILLKILVSFRTLSVKMSI